MSKNVTAKAVLKRARKLIEQGWAKGAFAKDKWRKRFVSPISEEAHSFCIMGALERASADLTSSSFSAEYHNARHLLESAAGVGAGQLANFNDYKAKSKKQVLATFDEAIKLAS